MVELIIELSRVSLGRTAAKSRWCARMCDDDLRDDSSCIPLYETCGMSRSTTTTRGETFARRSNQGRYAPGRIARR